MKTEWEISLEHALNNTHALLDQATNLLERAKGQHITSTDADDVILRRDIDDYLDLVIEPKVRSTQREREGETTRAIVWEGQAISTGYHTEEWPIHTHLHRSWYGAARNLVQIRQGWGLDGYKFEIHPREIQS